MKTYFTSETSADGFSKWEDAQIAELKQRIAELEKKTNYMNERIDWIGKLASIALGIALMLWGAYVLSNVVMP